MNKTLAVLPLRSGSTRIKDKNIRIIGYYPMFVHIVRTILSINIIDKLVISTDSNKYKQMINSYFPNNNIVEIINRPSNISGDDIKTEDVMLHVIESMKDIDSYVNMVLVQASTPLTEASDIEKAIYKIHNSNLNSVFSVSESKRFYLSDMDQIIERPMTQNKVPVQYEVGCFWVVNISTFKKVKNRVIEPFNTIVVSENSNLDIDDYNDFELVDLILSKKIRINERRYYKTRSRVDNDDNYYDDSNVDPDGIARNILYEEDSRVEFAKTEIKYINDYYSIIKVAKRPNLLSIGVGGGYAEKYISNHYVKYGVEPDIKAAKIAINNVDYLYNDKFENIEFTYSTFDLVFAHHVIEHIKDPIEFIVKINTILKVGGKLIIGTPNFDSAMARRYGDNFRMLNDPTHISLFSEMSLRDLLADFGFNVDYVDFPYFETKYFNKEDLTKSLNKEIISPPFYGSIMTFYATKI
jgi:CMP-N-acetylneuraminic acid synthetase/SAM-dependent methyltransferase